MTGPATDSSRQPSREVLIDMLRAMLLIRRTEDQIGRDSRAGKLPGNVHTYIGQEAVAVGVCSHLEPTDYITSTHRGHGHYLAKGGTPARLVAEVYAKRGGACRGFGGSMHVVDLDKGMLGANGIVGGGIAIAAGAALSASVAAKNQVAVAFFGDGAAAQGWLSEVLNMASLWKLPLVLVCENNQFAEFMRTEVVTAGRICDRARSYEVPAVSVDGNDVLAVWEAAGAAVERARTGAGATLIEALTYRVRGHVEAEAGFLPWKYRTDDEIASWAARDPIEALVARLRANGQLSQNEHDRIENEVAELVSAAAAFAEASEMPIASMLPHALFAASVDPGA
jgi:acetoin:2,6-dichlorophenolindophenol oxidoreductase subunit alpha